MKRTSLRIAFILAAWFCALSTASLAAEGMDELRSRKVQLELQLTQQDRDFRTGSDELDRLSKDIHRLKDQQRKSSTIVREYRLQSLLQKAQTLSDRLHRMESKRGEARAELSTVRARLLTTLDENAEAQRTIAHATLEPLDRRRSAAKEMERLIADRMQLSSEMSASALPGVGTLPETGKVPEEISEQIAVLQDFSRRMEKEKGAIVAELADTRRQQFLRRELSHLMDEESFFGEQGFARAGVTRKTEGTSTNSATQPVTTGSLPVGSASPTTSTSTSTSTTGDPATATGTTPPSGPTVSDQPSIVLPSSVSRSIRPSDSTLTENEPSGQRDPLAQLAGQLGVPLDESVRRASKTSQRDQVKWLEHRLATTRQLIQALENRITDLRHQLPKDR